MRRKLYLVAYDISSNGRLRKALHIARDYALGGQKSVFECWMNAAERREIEYRLDQVIDPQEDRYLILRLDPRMSPAVLGIAVPPRDPDWFMVG